LASFTLIAPLGLPWWLPLIGIAVVGLGQLPAGPGAGAAAAVLILGRHGVAAAAAAGVIMTVTGTVGGLIFVAGPDRPLVVGAPRPQSRALDAGAMLIGTRLRRSPSG
jgi:hypothetical protein